MKYIEELISDKNTPRLIPSFKQPERKLLSVFMSMLECSPNIRAEFLAQCGCRIAKTGAYQSLMEVSYKGSKYPDVRPDGLVWCRRGQTDWAAFIEAKADVGKIRTEQIQDYAQLADQVGVPVVITISNDFALKPDEPPYNIPKAKLKSRDLYHFAWADIRTFLELQRSNADLCEFELYVLDQCLEFFWEDGAGIRTYDAMPEGWPAFVEASSTALGFNSNIKGFSEIVYGWQQERRDLCSKLTHNLHRRVSLRHSAGIRADEDTRAKEDRRALSEDYLITAGFYIENEKLLLDVRADLRACKVACSMDLPLPEGKGNKALTTWLIKCLADVDADDAMLFFDWPGTKDDMQIGLAKFRDDPELVVAIRKDAPRRINISLCTHSVRRFKSRKLFIEDLEATAFRMLNLGKQVGWIL